MITHKSIPTFIMLYLLSVIIVYSQCSSSSATFPQMGAGMNPQFTNLWKHAQANDKFGNDFNNEGTLSIGDDGWPIPGKVHGIRFYPNDILPQLNNGDVIKFRYKGPATAITANLGFEKCYYQNIQPNTPTVGYTTAELKLETDFRTNPNGMYFQFYGKISEIQLIRPGYNFDDPRLLVDEYVTHVKHWKAFRFMGLSGVNGSMDMTWAKRVSKNAPISINVFQQSIISIDNAPWAFDKSNGNNENATVQQMGGGRPRGMSWEDQIDVCNYLNIDMWINIPVLVDDDYIKQLAALIKLRLKPNLNVNVEIGNELWNRYGIQFLSGYFMTQQLSWEFAYGTDEQRKIFGGSFCPGCNLTSQYDDGAYNVNAFPNGNVPYDAWQRWQARRLKEHAESFATVFGWRDEGGDVGNRIRMVLAGQIGYASNGMAWNIGPGIEFLKGAYGPDAPRKYLYAVAVTGYTTPQGGVNSSVNTIVATEKQSIDEQYAEYATETWGPNAYGNIVYMGNKLEGVFAKAKMFGLKMYAYEGGNEINTGGVGGSWEDFLNGDDYFNDSRSGDNTGLNLTNWYSWFGYDALFMKNGDFQQNPLSGYALSRTLNESNPVRNKYIQIANSNAPPLTTVRGSVLGLVTTTTLDARRVAAYWSDYAVGSFKIPTKSYGVEANSTDYSFKSENTFESPMIIRNQKNGKYLLQLERQLNNTITDDNNYPIYCDVFINEKKVISNFNFSRASFSRTINFDVDGLPRDFYWTTPVLIDIPYGVHTMRIAPVLPSITQPGTGGIFGEPWKNDIALMSYRFILSQELPPFQPKDVLGDLVVCNGNSKATYEVGENDISACDYLWSLPSNLGASILPPVSVSGSSPVLYSSGQGKYKVQIDWTGVPNGIYVLSVAARNFDSFSNLQSSPIRTFQVVVTECGFNFSPSPTCLVDVVTFTALNMPNVDKYEWDFDFNTIPNTLNTRFQYTKVPTTIKWSTVGLKSIKLTTTNTTTGLQLNYFKNINVLDCNGPTITGISKVDAIDCFNKGMLILQLAGNYTAGQVYQVDIDGNGSFTSALDGSGTISGIGSLTINGINPGRTVTGINNMRARLTTDFSKISPNFTCPTLIIAPANAVVMTISGSLVFCESLRTILTVSGANSYSWFPGNLTGNVNTISPAFTTTYTVTGNIGFCTASRQFVVTVNPNTVTITPSSSNICVNSSVSLTASGANTYNWQPGNINNSVLTTILSSMTVFTVVGTNSNGCVRTGVQTITTSNLTPGTASVPTGSINICNNTTSTGYQLSGSISNSVSNLWALRTVTGGTGNIPIINSLTGVVTWSNYVGQVNISVAGVNGCSVGAFSSPLLATRKSALTLLGSVFTSCTGNSLYYLSFTGTGGFGGTYSLTGNNISGTTLLSSPYKYTKSSIPDGFFYRLKLNDGCGNLDINGSAPSCCLNSNSYDFLTYTVCSGSNVVISVLGYNSSNPLIKNYTWEISTTNGASFKNITATGGGYTATQSSLTINSVNRNNNIYRLTYKDNCSPVNQVTFNNAIVTMNSSAGAWKGNGTSDWFTASNWCSNSVPTTTTDVKIYPGTPSPILNNSVRIKSLTIYDAANLSLIGNNAITITGDFTNNGSFNVSSTTSLVFTGTIANNILGTSGTELNNLITKNTVGLEINALITVLGSLNIENVNAYLGTNNKLTIGSTATRTGRIGPLSTSNIIYSDITVQRYFDAKKAYRFYSPAVAYRTINDFRNSIWITGFNENLDQGTSIPTLCWYIESATGSINSGWRINGNNITPLEVGRGYNIFINPKSTNISQINSTTTSVPVTLSLKGNINIGDIDLPITHTVSVSSADGWNLVGNPYPSEVDFGKVSGWTLVNILPSITYLNPETALSNGTNSGNVGSYVTYARGVACPDLVNNPNCLVIPSQQGFFVRSTAPGASMRIKETAKTNNVTRSYFREELFENLNSMWVKIKSDFNTDYAAIKFESNASQNYDEDKDIVKMTNSDLNISFSTNKGRRLSINYLPEPIDSMIIPIFVSSTRLGTHQLSFIYLDNLTFEAEWYLKDNFDNSYQKISESTIYNFEINSNQNSKGNRFELVIKRIPKSIVIVEPTPVTENTIPGLNEEYINNDEETISEIDQVTNSSNKLKDLKVEIFPNPINNDDINLYFTGYVDKYIIISIFNVNGVNVYSKKFSSDEYGNGKLVISSKEFPNGFYNLKVETNSKTKTLKLINNK